MALYVINKDEHSSGLDIGLDSKDFRFTATLDRNCLYDSSKFPEGDRLDINKLRGSTNGWTENHSGRFGWRCIDNSYFEILAYVRDGGEFKAGTETILGTVQPNEEFKCRLRNIGKLWIFNFNNGPDVKIDKSTNPTWPRWKLKFYFGGNNPAPHTMFCFIN